MAPVKEIEVMLKNIILFAIIAIYSPLTFSNERVKVHAYTSSKGFTFRNFSFMLTPENTVLASDVRLRRKSYSRNASNYRNEILDEKSINYIEYGQFQVFIPKEKFPLKNSADSFVIARMPQTSPGDPEYDKHVKKKKQLYERISRMVKEGEGSVQVVFEFPHPNSEKIEANVYFRSYNGDYIDKVGKL
ncbi:hypothetical protein JQC92_09065 [Shewanella sp. 202IG2-18]|uniref:hypothetical protein n=1 Tax=Parashewanella hymeniacidonis TaxID=2807618 RepID=UPI001960579E|nr:hypothetical protein [Parashewanella hymeniacidonis]MBM7072175.1 hypothetical protein [Parashewanella hymeniacidonis]